MAQSILNWTPAGGSNSLNQIVQYKLNSSATWINFSTLTAGINTVTITGLLANKVYDFRIVDNCQVGGQVPSATVTTIVFACATVVSVPVTSGITNSIAFTPSYDKVTVDLYWVPADVNKIVFQLLATDGTTLLQTQTTTPYNVPYAYSIVFDTLATSTNYKVKVTLYAGAGFIYNSVCTNVSVTTIAAPVCTSPTGVSVTMS